MTAPAVGCGGGGSGEGSSPDTATDTAPPSASAGREPASTGDIPGGGGVILKEEKIVVTQPERGGFNAFSAICTRRHCLLADVSDGTVDCACHGSRFRVTDGSVDRGPAASPLSAEQITAEGNSIRLA
ncbi:Rieske (2Fe-2S) protein [Streptomyces sp. GDS52]|uniref:Rieske (2Fe-2S) protein n=1 Tax=Streptomyces sp. GDS52 TaxID=3406419 RepID=UPI003FD0F7E1